jgi:hypothetical protein
MSEEQTWIPVDANDTIFTTSEDGDVVAIKTDRGVFGEIVRKRSGQWMKRTDPKVILSAQVIGDKIQAKKYKTGKDLPA